MNSDSVTSAFFNRAHFVQGAQLLASILCMLGVIFIGLDWRGLGFVRTATFVWFGAGLLLSVAAAIGARRVRRALLSLVSGVAIGLLFLAVTWFLARTGG